ncbi:MAG: hypothetical protein Q8Q52_06550, partial [Acidimicrobiia bacterium]|nr:hypothetical protein [Acidimicrobiia bacterium]
MRVARILSTASFPCQEGVSAHLPRHGPDASWEVWARDGFWLILQSATSLFLAALLTSLEGEDLSGYDRVVVLRAQQRMASHYQAQVYKAMASISELMEEVDHDPRTGPGSRRRR